jgi:hypothetical protein
MITMPAKIISVHLEHQTLSSRNTLAPINNVKRSKMTTPKKKVLDLETTELVGDVNVKILMLQCECFNVNIISKRFWYYFLKVSAIA